MRHTRPHVIDLFGITIVVLIDDRHAINRLHDARMAAMRHSGELARRVIQASVLR